jgi:membrane protein DedA with SNARE-associated domain/rhodanese-related sulfurtransferase
MSASAEFLLQHGYSILFVTVLVEQIGLPFPSGSLLMAAGALAGLHFLNPILVLSTALAASLLGDSPWYVLGKRRGNSILGWACQVSIEPDTCVSRMHTVYYRYGASSLLFCKFVPQLGTLGPPMAGLMGLQPGRFLLLDSGGALIWSGAFVTIGWICREQIELIGVQGAKMGTRLAIAIVFTVVMYALWKYIQRRRFYRKLRLARITPFELKHLMDTQARLNIFDLRNPGEWREGRIPGSLPLEQQQVHSMVPAKTDAEVVFYCSCPKEADSARAALRLKQRGVPRVRPLEGGFERWNELGFPVEEG